MKRLLIALMTSAAVFSVAFASAAALQVNGGVIQAGEDLDLTCTDEVTVLGWGLETDDGMVSNVRIGGLEPCAGADMFVTITGTGGSVLDTTTVPLDGDDAKRVFFDPQSAESITDIHIYIEGADAD